jgi:hypothetical protein
MKRLIALHLIGNALLLWLGYYWLGLGESTGLYLAYSFAVILIFTLGALWLHGTALVYFQQNKLLALRNLPPLFCLALVIALVYFALDRAYESFGHDAFVIGSFSTMKLRRPVAPTGVLRAFHAFIWLLRWLIVPVLAIPLASEVASSGWQGFHKRAFHLTRKPLFWIESLALLLIAFWVPFRLFFWIPKVSSFTLELFSLALRLGLGYLLFVAALLTLEYFAGKPRTTQPSTVVSP